MKTNRILFAITLIASPLALNAYQGLNAMGGSTLANSQGINYGNTVSNNAQRPTFGQRSTVQSTTGIAPQTRNNNLLGREQYPNNNMYNNNRYLGGNAGMRNTGLVNPLRK